MVLAVAAPVAGVARPSTSMAPPAVSLIPAANALGLPGLKPMASMAFPVPVTPWPPNQPNSFCAPCAARIPPTPTRRTRRAISLRETAAMVLLLRERQIDAVCGHPAQNESAVYAVPVLLPSKRPPRAGHPNGR